MPSPYLPNTDADRRAMLQEIGAGSIEELFLDIPEKVRHAQFKLPPPLSELELKKELSQLASRNASLDKYACFLGAGSTIILFLVRFNTLSVEASSTLPTLRTKPR